MAYSITVGFIDSEPPNCVQFTSFVGEGRRSFRFVVSESDVPSAAMCGVETFCRLAIGQVIRDSLSLRSAKRSCGACGACRGHCMTFAQHAEDIPPLPRLKRVC